ncbi:hypothetical protein H2202_002137 [Exophiala xenobiotica]|nr:hypothetical protein H2202_002137 [Exophiala xenobiotica]KAK5208396.1 hypothetical protein LTR41_005622 [Exophiala xenobiotica]KAK5225486.1 hypothetical protein LTR47_009333 [Exophiala xenobiotica]KAK5243247.1 hypothetical protein LTS06_010943 [Exophiala xenobiotica]KAK5258872.1 hypothetical protein LTR40_007043 [Exophiala xenobiotica]
MRKASMSWLWKGDANSPASFERALSKLSSQVTAANLALDTTRSRARRAKALWTLYTTLTYLLYTLVVVLVLGPEAWSWYHYAGLAGGPVTIYAVRKLLSTFFDWRVNRQQSHLDHLQKQRDAKIADLKKATKYDSTQELLQKYGGAPPTKTPSKQPQQGSKRKVEPASGRPTPQRTGIPPPPTANIPGRNMNTPPAPRPHVETIPTSAAHGQSPLTAQMMANSPADISPDAPGFAPNAFTNAPPPSTAYEHAHHWYDRILDVMLGEDETAAKNRLVLLCSNCRLVNGQAPPGVKTLEELGRWRCSGCGAWNGAESEGAKVVKEITAASNMHNSEDWEKVPRATRSSEDLEEVHDGSSLGEAGESVHGTTGRDGEDESGITKRVTRSAGKKPSLDSLE